MKKVVYTCLFGDYKLYEPQYLNPDWQYLCFTDQNLKSDNWKIIKVECEDQKKKSREIKINSHFFFDYDICLYIDAKFKVKIDLNKFSENLKHDICLMKHNKRNCLYDEGLFCIEKNKDSKSVIMEQLNYYKSMGMPKNYGLYAPGIMLKKHNGTVHEFMMDWYHQVEHFSYRDIISFSYVHWKNPIKVDLLPFKETYGSFK